MRPLLLVSPLALALLAGSALEAVQARPEFARRESKACGYCHINPRGGGARNETGLSYARNEFSFPVRKGNMTSFERDKDRERMVYARKLLDIQHIPAALRALRRLAASVRRDPAAARLVAGTIHGLEVKGTQILGEARLLLRKGEREEGVALLALLAVEYKGLAVRKEALVDLREARAKEELRELVKREEREAKARLVYLDALRHRLDKKEKKVAAAVARLLKAYPESRAAEAAVRELAPRDAPD